MSKQTLNSLINQSSEIVFVSPHFDDVVLSCGQLMTDLAKRNKKITVINVFTKAHSGPYTLSAKTFLSSSGSYTNATKLYSNRAKEDEIALSSIKVKKVINLGFTDALFRKLKTTNWINKLIPETVHLYPTYRWHIVKNNISLKDNSVEKITARLSRLVKKNAIIFAPLGIATHVDHVIAKEACERLGNKIVYYSEFPYNLRAELPKEAKKYQLVSRRVNLSNKKSLISLYKTQFPGLFPGGLVPDHREKFFFKSK